MNPNLDPVALAALLDCQMWAATEDVAHRTQLALASIAAGAQDVRAAMHDDDEEDEDPIYTSLDELGLGIVHIHGSLVAREHWANKYFGLVSYEAIQSAVNFAAQDEAVNAIVLDISSGGGQVAGLHDAAQAIGRVNREVKPVYAIGSDLMASAAYWLGTSGRAVYATESTVVGSIGIIRIHQEITGLLEKMGVKAEVLRVGEHKALGQMVEPLTDRARAQMLEPMQQTYRMFLSHVGAHHGLSADEVDARMGQGRIFMGQRAADVGLVAKVGGFDPLLAHIYTQTLDKSRLTQSQFGRNLV